MKWDALFFDFDGVLADSVEIKAAAFAKLYEPFGPEIEQKVIDHHRRHGGVTRAEKFKIWHREFLKHDLTEEELAHLSRRFSDLVVEQVIKAPEIRGARAFLKRFHGRVPMFVISATPPAELGRIIDGRDLSGYFEDTRGSDRKKEEHLRDLLEKWALDPARCVFFGDALSDYEAARSCGVPFAVVVPGPDAPVLKAAPEAAWRPDFDAVARDFL